MGKTLQLEPSPEKSYRDTHESWLLLEMAVGDIIDNSIAAKASNIWIYSPQIIHLFQLPTTVMEWQS